MTKKYVRVGFTSAQKTELWQRWRSGEQMKSIGRELGLRSHSDLVNDSLINSVSCGRCAIKIFWVIPSFVISLVPHFLSQIKQTYIRIKDVNSLEGDYYGCNEIRTNYVRQFQII